MSPSWVAARPTRIVVCCGNRLFREALVGGMQAPPDVQIAGHAAELDELPALCQTHDPDVVLVDLGASGEGPASLATLRSQVGRARVVVVYGGLTPAGLAALWQAGVSGLVPYSHGLAALNTVVRRHAAGRAVADADPGGAGAADPASPRGADEELSQKEREVISLLSAGNTVDRIAEQLDLSRSAVTNTKRRIYHKLRVASQGQAIARAAELGLVARPPARTAPEAGSGGVVAIVRGGEASTTRQVAAALLAGGVAFALGVAPGTGGELAVDGVRVLFVLVDPQPSDRLAGGEVGLPVILVRTVVPARPEMLDALRSGVVAVVAVDRVAADLAATVTMAGRGYRTLTAGAVEALLDGGSGPVTAPAVPPPTLTARERDILQSIAAGHTVRQTGRALGIAEKTVENTQARLFRKLGAHNRSGALSIAYALGLLDLTARTPVPSAERRRADRPHRRPRPTVA